MTQGGIPPKSSHKGLLTCITIVAAGVIGLICIAGLGVWYFTRSAQARNRPFLSVISAPTSGTLALSGAPIEIQASSTYSEGVIRLDLFADGGLIASQPTTLAKGSNPLVMIHRWTPATPGRHVLMARAHARDGSRSDSSVVFIDVSQEAYRSVVEISNLQSESGTTPTLNEISASTGISLGALLDANPDLDDTDPDTPLDADDTLTLPPEEGGTEEAPSGPEAIPETGAPASPENLVVDMTCTDATLTWVDASTDEEAFVVYRIDPGTSTMHPVSGPLAAGTITYVDAIPAPGEYYYQIGARRDAEESFSLVVGAATPATCVAPPGGLDLVLTLGLLETDNPFLNVSCYVILTSAGPVVDRIPAGDFTGLPPSGPNQYRLDSLANRGQYVLNFHDPAAAVELSLNCMGRNPPYADSIGHADISHPPSDWSDGSVRTATSTAGTNGNFTVSYCLGPSTTPCEIPGAPPPPPSPWMIDFFLPPPTNLRIENSTETCLDLTDAGERMFCQIWGGIIGGYPTLLWDWDGAPHYEETDLTGYHVRLESRDRATGDVALRGEWDVLRRLDGTLGRALRDVTDPAWCSTDLLYYVSAVAGDLRSTESDSYTISTPDCFAPVNVAVEFSNLEIQDVNDCGDFTIFPPDTFIEASLDFFVTSGIHGHHFVYGMPRNIETGTNSPVVDIFGSVFRAQMPIESDTQTIDVRLRLTDHDNLFMCPADPTFCDIHFEIPARSQAEWHAYTHTFINNDLNSDAHCTTTIIVDGTGP